MKKVLFVLALLGSLQASAQLKEVDGVYQFQKITSIRMAQDEWNEKTSEWVEHQLINKKTAIDAKTNKIQLDMERTIHISGKPITVQFQYTVAFGPGWYQEKATNFTIQKGQSEFKMSDTGWQEKKLIVSATSFEINMISESLMSCMYSDLYASCQSQNENDM
ncbi:hypothetical protein [Reichenbachiella ulvae]|uniref:DUF4468 domain-containing protein n=1 Tax=Reichenbachiella ulvae TaxID=2980104 RepID=A0ABT3CNN3_9BACT|nr:hypothetical protein [Reichenbachiella ulvae]MCV9385207.1 hypothetical protein [Reichenbachiella ulvae]